MSPTNRKKILEVVRKYFHDLSVNSVAKDAELEYRQTKDREFKRAEEIANPKKDPNDVDLSELTIIAETARFRF